MRIHDRVAFGSSLWRRFARCVARSVIVVAGKFASILICGLDYSSCVTHSHNPFCVFAFLVVRDFLGSEEIGSFLPKKLNLFWFWPIHIFYRGKHVLILTISMQTWRFLLKRVWSAGAPQIFAPARTPQKPQIFGKGIFAVLLYNLQLLLLLLLPNCPPIRSYLSYLI